MTTSCQLAFARHLILVWCLLLSLPSHAESSLELVRDQIARHPGETGVFVLDTGEEALLARAWLADRAITYIGTFNLDPRSENLNTEVGVIVRDPVFASRVTSVIGVDMLPENSWNASDEPDQYVPVTKRGRVRMWQLLPLKATL